MLHNFTYPTAPLNKAHTHPVVKHQSYCRKTRITLQQYKWQNSSTKLDGTHFHRWDNMTPYWRILLANYWRGAATDVVYFRNVTKWSYQTARVSANLPENKKKYTVRWQSRLCNMKCYITCTVAAKIYWQSVKPLTTKRMSYIRTQCAPRCKHSPLRL
jgi:hypothetical protein